MKLYTQQLMLAKKVLFVAMFAVISQFVLPQYAVAAEMAEIYAPGPTEHALVSSATANTLRTDRLPEAGKSEPRIIRYVMSTAYSSTPDQTDSTPFITADGSRVRDGIVAANFLPFGTKVKIPELYGDKIFEVHDRMHKKYPNRMDLWMETREEAKIYGARYIKIEIY